MPDNIDKAIEWLNKPSAGASVERDYSKNSHCVIRMLITEFTGLRGPTSLWIVQSLAFVDVFLSAFTVNLLSGH